LRRVKGRRTVWGRHERKKRRGHILEINVINGFGSKARGGEKGGGGRTRKERIAAPEERALRLLNGRLLRRGEGRSKRLGGQAEKSEGEALSSIRKKRGQAILKTPKYGLHKLVELEKLAPRVREEKEDVDANGGRGVILRFRLRRRERTQMGVGQRVGPRRGLKISGPGFDAKGREPIGSLKVTRSRKRRGKASESVLRETPSSHRIKGQGRENHLRDRRLCLGNTSPEKSCAGKVP